MRPTLLNFRSPNERTAEYRKLNVTRDGKPMSLAEKGVKVTGSSLPREARWKEAPLICKKTGATVFLGPGSYNDHTSFIKFNKMPCSTKIQKPGGKNYGNQEYIMIGDQIKYEPAWIMSKK